MSVLTDVSSAKTSRSGSARIHGSRRRTQVPPRPADGRPPRLGSSRQPSRPAIRNAAGRGRGTPRRPAPSWPPLARASSGIVRSGSGGRHLQNDPPARGRARRPRGVGRRPSAPAPRPRVSGDPANWPSLLPHRGMLPGAPSPRPSPWAHGAGRGAMVGTAPRTSVPRRTTRFACCSRQTFTARCVVRRWRSASRSGWRCLSRASRATAVISGCGSSQASISARWGSSIEGRAGHRLHPAMGAAMDRAPLSGLLDVRDAGLLSVRDAVCEVDDDGRLPRGGRGAAPIDAPAHVELGRPDRGSSAITGSARARRPWMRAALSASSRAPRPEPGRPA